MERAGETQFRLTVADNGVGLPAGFDFRKAESLGLQIVHMLVEQIGGTIQVRAEGGTSVEILFGEMKPAARA